MKCDFTSIPKAIIGVAVGGTMGHFHGKYLDPLPLVSG
jgi:hypothetical protein